MRRMFPLLLVACAGCATGTAPTRISEVGPGKRISVHVEVDTKGVPLGAYQLLVVYNRAEARIVEVRAGDGSEFAEKPRFHNATFTSGATRVTGYSVRQGVPRGPYKLLTVVFQQTGAPVSPFNVNVESLYDTSRPPRPITRFDVTPSHDVLDFSKDD